MHADALMRGAFARFWSMRMISTLLAIGAADMADLWLERMGLHAPAQPDLPFDPHDLAGMAAHDPADAVASALECCQCSASF